jgi:hypothetical protein
MPVPSDIADLSQTAGNNSPPGSESPTTADDYLRAQASFIAMLRDGVGFSEEADVASAATCSIGAVNSMLVRITGTTTITSFGTTYNGPRFIRFADALTLTHNASTLILPGGANITTAAGDTCIATPISGGWRVSAYQKTAYPGGALIGVQTFTSSGTYTPTAGMRFCVVEVQAPGGAGGGVAVAGGSNVCAAGGGGGGGYAKGRFTAAEVGSSVAVTIGAAGAGVSGASGGDGGTSSFGALLSVPGGKGGSGHTGGGASSSTVFQIGGGAPSDAITGTTLFAVPGEQGGNSLNTSSSLYTGAGGASFYGSGGVSRTGGNTTGANGLGFGGGGSGACNGSGGGARAGGDGAPGKTIVWEYA